MATKYPVILVHGIAAKQSWVMNAFGKIGDALEADGNDVYIADNDGFGRIATNAEQLRAFIENVLEKTGKEKVNIIAHSKGGLDSKYMITELGMEDKIASLMIEGYDKTIVGISLQVKNNDFVIESI